MSAVEARFIAQALERLPATGAAARLLGLKRTTLVEKLKRLGAAADEDLSRAEAAGR